ncbi:MAG: hypothetical protein LBJ47_06640 [Tannerella sp.]|jgi:hypothetical protein|nr:hypothetical protein [Tannerella sp.]
MTVSEVVFLRHCEGTARSNPGTGDDPDCFLLRPSPFAGDGGPAFQTYLRSFIGLPGQFRIVRTFDVCEI